MQTPNASQTSADPHGPQPLAGLPCGVRARFLDGVNGLRMHVLEAGEPGRDLVLLLHGFPELAWSWRKVLVPLAETGFHVAAPDLRGFGRTTGCDDGFDCDLAPFGPLNVARDVAALAAALGAERVRLVVGHDSGASAAAVSALARPELFDAVALMSAPFAEPSPARRADLGPALAALDPPRRHYQAYYSTRPAEADMRLCAQGLPAFLRAYSHVKSGDWPGNAPHPLPAWSAEALAVLPTYYVMRAGQTMAETVAPHLPAEAPAWLTDAELAVYAGEYARTGFQGGLNWYRCRTGGLAGREMSAFAGRAIEAPAVFVAGARDWGVHQTPGALEAMRTRAFTRMGAPRLVAGAGHWVQQEAPEEVVRLLLAFLAGVSR